MLEHRQFNRILPVGLFLLPAAISPFFAWSVWVANKRPAIATWRLTAFNWVLISSLATMAIFVPSCVHMMGTLEPA